jgi:hypothetical protein
METLARPSTSWDCKPNFKYCLRLQFLPIAELSSAKGLVNDWANVNKLDSPCQRPPGHFAVTEDVVTEGHHGTGDFPVGGTGQKGHLVPALGFGGPASSLSLGRIWGRMPLWVACPKARFLDGVNLRKAVGCVRGYILVPCLCLKKR